MRMEDQTNPRKLTTSGGMTVVSIPDEFLDDVGLEMGDRVVLQPTDEGFEAVPVEWEVSS